MEKKIMSMKFSYSHKIENRDKTIVLQLKKKDSNRVFYCLLIIFFKADSHYQKES